MDPFDRIRARFLLPWFAVAAVIIAFAAVTLGVYLWVNEGPVWRLVMTKRVYDEDHGWVTFQRWTDPLVPHGPSVSWWTETGFRRW